MERSRAIKCPTVRSQLSGCKKVQQELARPGAVERFIQDTAAVQRIRNTFAGLYSLEQVCSWLELPSCLSSVCCVIFCAACLLFFSSLHSVYLSYIVWCLCVSVGVFSCVCYKGHLFL